MTPQPLFAALFGGWEIILILAVFVVMLLMIATIGAIISFLSRRRQTPPPNPPAAPTPPTPAGTTETPQGNCPHCGKPVPPTALGGICPECMLKAGLATQTEGPGATGPHGTKVIHPPPAPAEIAALFPQLEILECLGRGGMGVVYQARQPRLNRLVALKILAREKEQDAHFTERFTREAQALARLNHPNIVTVHDFGEAGGHCYLVMEFVDGLNLRQLLQTGKMPPEQALTIVPKICEALQYAHEQGIVHRDIKPENILLDKSGRVKIADFGIAKMMGVETGQQTLTGAKDAVGTPHYMAPEQIEKPLTVDHRADIYSLGVVFYEMLTGELPLGKFQPPSQKVQVDVRLDEVVLHALEKEPERRYQQASVLKTEVETIASTPESGRSRREEAQTEKATGQRLLTSSPISQVSRFPRTAIVGAAWTPFFLAAILSIIFGQEQFPQAYGGLSRILLFLGLAAPVATTMLGWLAVAQIRHSTGRFHGLELAVFDGLFFPLFGVDLLIGIFWLILAKTSAHWRGLDGSLFYNLWEFALWALLLTAICAAFDFLIARYVWHRMNQPFKATNTPTQTRWTGIVLSVLTGALLSAGIISFIAASLILCCRNVDNVNRPFEDDPQVIGHWTCIDFVSSPDDFKTGAQTWKGWKDGSSVFKNFTVLPDGRTSYRWLTWTKGAMINKGEKTAGNYEVRNFDGTNYLFVEWKNGDYILFHSIPWFFVLRESETANTNFFIGQAWLPEGDSIEITSVERTENQMTVKGHYNLVSHDRALLALYCTSTNRTNVPEDRTQRMQISKGQGDFELARFHLFPGLHHVSMYANGHFFASVYFGTKTEALEESRATWITNQTTSNGGGSHASAMAIAPTTGLPVVPGKVQTIDPNTGLPMTRSGAPTINPATGLPISPGQDGTIDPVTGLPVTPADAKTDASAAPANQPPTVVKTFPQAGATNVDLAITEITVTFDRDMDDGFSWTGGGPDFPPSPEGQHAYWRDKRTCVLPVKLEAAHYYRVGINSKSFQNFRSADGVPAQPSAVYFATQGASEQVKAMVAQPEIVSLIPANGAQDVDPNLTEIRVTFNMPMGEGFSWTGGGSALLPGREGKNCHWTEDHKTCVLPVQLQPDHAYHLGLNSPSHKNFQSDGGVPLAPVDYRFKTRAN
jgi:predicted Ser/Thr protein kinase